MNAEAFRLIQECFITKDTYLDLGGLGLTDADFVEGTELDKLLRQCVHLETLIFSYTWNDWQENQWIARKSKNEGLKNQFSVCPPAVKQLKNLVKLIMGGYYGESWEISDMSFIAGFSKLQYLILNHNKLNKIEGIEELTVLKELDLRSNKIKKISGLYKLTALKRLDLSNNFITEMEELDNLSALEQLYLGANIITEISGLDKLNTLKQLFLSGNFITEIGGLDLSINLEQLEIHHNQIRKIKGLDSLKALKVLNLNNNKIGEIEGLEEVKGLIQLNLSGNQIKVIKGLENQSSLTELYLSGNQISEIEGFEFLVALEHLSIVGNNISQIKNIETLLKLMHLDLRGNNISQIEGLDKLPVLEKLLLSGNKINDLKGLEFIKKKEATDLHLQIRENPLLSKYEIELNESNNHLPLIKELLVRMEGEQKTFYFPLKIMMLGNHACGKSSLVDMVTGVKNTGSTHILRIQNYTIQKTKSKAALLPDAIFYDFGGQDFYHGLYQAFISGGGIQVLVFDAAKDTNGPGIDENDGSSIINFNRHYWLGQRVYKQMDNPYIVAQTHADEEDAGKTIPMDYTAYQGYRYSFLLSLQAKAKLAAPKKQYWPVYKAGQQHCKIYIDVLIKELLQTQKREAPQWYINFLQFVLQKRRKDYKPTLVTDLLSKYELDKPDAEKIESLKTNLTLLHRHGLVLYYDTPQLQSNVWLNPQELVKHIQQNVLKKEKMISNEGDGVKKKDFEMLFKNDNKILWLLLEQKVVFLHKPSDKPEDAKYIMPNYLPIFKDTDNDFQLFGIGLTQPDFVIKFNDFIPFGFINQLICFFGKQPDVKKFWRNQLLFTLNKEVRVLIQLDFSVLTIKVFVEKVSGKTPDLKNVQTYLFYAILGLYWDRWELPGYEEIYAVDKSLYVQENEFGDITAMSAKGERMQQQKKAKTHDEIVLEGAAKNRVENWQKLQDNNEYIPADAYLSVDGVHFIHYKALSELKDEYRLPAYTLKADGRIDKETAKEIPASPFAPFTNNTITAMKKIFISYSQKDTRFIQGNGVSINFKEELETHLKFLKRLELSDTWSDTNLFAGDDWNEIIKQQLEESDIVLFLVSASLIATDYVWSEEMPLARFHKKHKKAILIPVILNHCQWQSIPLFSESNAVPHKGNPIATYNNREEAYNEITERIKAVLQRELPLS